jgi:hypothetical protein
MTMLNTGGGGGHVPLWARDTGCMTLLNDSLHALILILLNKSLRKVIEWLQKTLALLLTVMNPSSKDLILTIYLGGGPLDKNIKHKEGRRQMLASC